MNNSRNKDRGLLIVRQKAIEYKEDIFSYLSF